jgi:group I intron endonuclease
MFIYLITNDINDKGYVGLSIRDDLRKRWRVHLSHAKKGNGKCRALHSAMRKYGIDNFHVTSIWSGQITRRKLGGLEEYFIRSFRTVAPDGYNICGGGEGVTGTHRNAGTNHRGFGWHHSEETKKEISRRLREEHVNRGRKASVETLNKRAATMKAISASPEYRRHLSESVTQWWAKRKGVLPSA